ncbi:MAG: DNA replication/repair protein RecF [Clostridiaceae bacterium]
MYVKWIKLRNFRNYKELYLEFSKGVNVLIGDNAQGKTNILEGIYYCSLGKSHRTSRDKEIIKWNEDSSFVSVYTEKKRIDRRIDIKISKEGKKSIKVNSIGINKITDLIGNLNCVIFSPEDLKIVKESPSYRRKFLDIELCKLDRKYFYCLVKYNKLLNEKNNALRKWSKINNDLLDIYDQGISQYGGYIVKERLKYLEKLNNICGKMHKEITENKEALSFEYITSIKNLKDIEVGLLEELKISRVKDFERRTNSHGPNKDDFSVLINGVDARYYGSQGQQRTAVLSMKFACLEIIKEIIGEYPVLLLDDVLSELDYSRQKYILSSVNNVQTIITTTGSLDIKNLGSEDLRIFKVENESVELFKEE